MSISGWLLGHQSGVLMANQRSTRVQRICKKLQTVRGAGAAAWFGFWAVGDFFRGGDAFPLERGAAEIFWEGSFWFGCFGEESWRREREGKREEEVRLFPGV